MKLRINESSVRLRLRRSDVEQFRNTGSVAAVTQFPDGRTLTYRLSRGTGDETTVSFAADTIEVRVPAAVGEEWCRGEQVGIYGVVGTTEILVEKDFRRTSLPSPDDDDRYPNPRAITRAK